MKSNKKKKVSLYRPVLIMIGVVLVLMIAISIFLIKRPKVLGATISATYTKETIIYGIYSFGLYYPSGTNKYTAPYPVIIFNHGMLMQYAYYSWFAEAMANKGYIVIMPNRIPPGVIMEEGKRLNKFVLSYLSARNKFTSSLRGKVDLKKVGIAGHSMGADLSLFNAGISNLKAILAIAPADKETGSMKVVANATTDLPLGQYIEKSMNKIYSNISLTNVPIMYLTGSLDGIVTPKASQTLYDLTRSKKIFLILNGANHLQFSPTETMIGKTTEAALDENPTMSSSKVQELTITYGGAWFDYFIKGDQTAKTILDEGTKVDSKIFSSYQTNY